MYCRTSHYPYPQCFPGSLFSSQTSLPVCRDSRCNYCTPSPLPAEIRLRIMKKIVDQLPILKEVPALWNYAGTRDMVKKMVQEKELIIWDEEPPACTQLETKGVVEMTISQETHQMEDTHRPLNLLNPTACCVDYPIEEHSFPPQVKFISNILSSPKLKQKCNEQFRPVAAARPSPYPIVFPRTAAWRKHLQCSTVSPTTPQSTRKMRSAAFPEFSKSSVRFSIMADITDMHVICGGERILLYPYPLVISSLPSNDGSILEGRVTVKLVTDGGHNLHDRIESSLFPSFTLLLDEQLKASFRLEIKNPSIYNKPLRFRFAVNYVVMTNKETRYCRDCLFSRSFFFINKTKVHRNSRTVEL